MSQAQFLCQVLETPLGVSYRNNDLPDDVKREREKIVTRYQELRGVGFDVASLQARTEWLENYLTNNFKK